MKLSDFDFDLPTELIAQHPPAERGQSRLLVCSSQSEFEHHQFPHVLQMLRPNDVLVVNDTRVIPARVFSDDGRTELLCLDRLSPMEWRCLVRPGKRMKPGHSVSVGGISGGVSISSQPSSQTVPVGQTATH